MRASLVRSFHGGVDRQDTGRKWAKKVVTDHDALAVEDFKPTFLAKSTMAKKAADAATDATKQAEGTRADGTQFRPAA